MSSEPIYYDPYDYEIDDNPHEIWKRLRDEAPIWHNDKYDFWVLSRYDDVVKASLDTETFSSAYGTTLESIDDVPKNSGILIYEDPPYHDHLRTLVQPHFTPASIAALEDETREIVLGYLKPLEQKDEFDFVEDFARWIPMDVVSAMLGVPVEERRMVNDWVNAMVHIEDGQFERGPEHQEVNDKTNAYFMDMLKKRRANPQNDLATAIATGLYKDETGERLLTDDEATAMIFIVGVAGNETAARLLASCSWLLAKHPEQRQKLRENPSLIPRAIEEVLRLEPPSPIQSRRVMKDFEIHGTVVPAGSRISLLTASAGRDERQYENPEVFDIERDPRRHVSFGYGIHNCLGSSVARMELRIALEEILKRIPDWDVDWDNMVRVRTSSVRGFKNIPVRIKR